MAGIYILGRISFRGSAYNLVEPISNRLIEPIKSWIRCVTMGTYRDVVLPNRQSVRENRPGRRKLQSLLKLIETRSECILLQRNSFRVSQRLCTILHRRYRECITRRRYLKSTERCKSSSSICSSHFAYNLVIVRCESLPNI
jgi:hypothetical protein